MKRILIAGGAGFIGSNLCERLLNEGHYVICVDNYFSGLAKNIKHLLNNKYFRVIEQDICLPLDGLEVDEIYNLACPASPLFYQKDPIFTLKSSVIGSINLLDLARQNKAKIFLASTSEVYGNPQEHPQKESYWGNVNPIGARACYDEGKRSAETLFFDYHRQYGIEIKVARLFNTYGPRMRSDDGRVVTNFITQALTGKNITIYGDGSQTRSLCYIDDLIDAITLFMQTGSTECGPLNLGNPTETTINELANLVDKVTRSDIKVVFKELPTDDPVRRKPDITNAKRLLNWQPTVDIISGLKRTKYFIQESINFSDSRQC